MKNSLKKYISEILNDLFERITKNEINKFIEKDFKLNEFKYFNGIEDIENWEEDYSSYYQELLQLSGKMQASKEQLEELNDLDHYCGYYAEKMNNHLRGKTEDIDLIERIHNMDKYFDKFILKENIIVIRRMPNKFIDKRYNKNSKFVEKGFLSTSLNLLYRLDYESNYKPLKNETLMIIKVPKGIRGIFLEKSIPENKQRKEYEFLISRNQTIKVEYNKKILSNRLMKLEIIA